MTEQDNFGRLTQAMALLGDTLAPFVERELKRAGQGWWTNSVLPNVSPLTRQKLPSLPKKGLNGQLGVLDVADLLSLVTKNFSVAFRNRLPDSARSYAEELRSARTTWAHKPSSGDIEAAVADRAIDTAALLLDSIEPSAAAAVRHLKAQGAADRITNEVATLLGVDTRTVQRRAAAAGVGRRVGTTLVFTPAEVDRLAEARPRGRPAGSIRRALGLDAEAVQP